jgi:hypothetical protein
MRGSKLIKGVVGHAPKKLLEVASADFCVGPLVSASAGSWYSFYEGI